MVAHAILFIVLPLAFAWLVGVTACLPPYSLPPTRKPEPEIEPEFEEEVRAFLAQHGRRDAAAAGRMVPGVPGDAPGHEQHAPHRDADSIARLRGTAEGRGIAVIGRSPDPRQRQLAWQDLCPGLDPAMTTASRLTRVLYVRRGLLVLRPAELRRSSRPRPRYGVGLQCSHMPPGVPS